MRCGVVVRCVACVATGIALSTAHPIGIVLSVGVPAWVLNQPTRHTAFACVALYYFGVSWPIIPAARNFFGSHASAIDALVLWIVAAFLLSTPWLLVWTNDRLQFLWRAPVGLLLTVVPPLGLIGWASPLTAAGFLFPGTSWFGLLALAVAAGSLAFSPRLTIALLGVSTVILNIFYVASPGSPGKWQAINTNFGGISHEHTSALAEFEAVESIQRRALTSSAQVIVFPETVVPAWTAATDAFWNRTLTTLRLRGKTIVVGAKIVEPGWTSELLNRDLTGSITTLNSTQPPRGLAAPTGGEVRSRFRNVLIVRGLQETVFEQRVPVPIGMWRPFDHTGAPLHLNGAAVLPIAGERAAVLICYEQLLTWPILASMIHHPTMIIAVANDHWASGTTIPKFQLNAVRAWARLISVPYVSATNF